MGCHTRNSSAFPPGRWVGTPLVKDRSTFPDVAMPTLSRPAPHALSVLLTRFVAGEIAESALTTVCDLLEETPASAEERIAFARFYLDALSTGDSEHALPRAEELADVIQIARA